MPTKQAIRSAAILNDVPPPATPQLSTKLSTASVNIGFLPVVPSAVFLTMPPNNPYGPRLGVPLVQAIRCEITLAGSSSRR